MRVLQGITLGILGHKIQMKTEIHREQVFKEGPGEGKEAAEAEEQRGLRAEAGAQAAVGLLIQAVIKNSL